MTGTRLTQISMDAPSAGESFSIDELHALPRATIGDILKQAAGGTVMEYGAPGSLQLASFRGLGAEYTTVYLNGIRINTAQNSLVDLARLPGAFVESIDIVRGEHASLYGADVLGGIVNIRSSRANVPVSLTAGAGSYGWKTVTASTGLHGRGGWFRIAGSYEDARNDYAVVSRLSSISSNLLRTNADHISRAVEATGALEYPRSRLSMFTRISTSEIGVPGALTSEQQGAARQSDQDVSVTVAWMHAVDGSSIVDVSVAGMSSFQSYNDPLTVINGHPLASDFRNLSAAMNGRYETRVLSTLLLSAGLDCEIATLETVEVSGTPHRLTLAGWFTVDASLSPVVPALHLFPALRWDIVREEPQNRSTTILSPSLGYTLPVIPHALSIRGRIAWGTKLPTFNQLYWLPGGNPNLRPESVLTTELGFQGSIPQTPVSFELTGHFADVREKIIWMPQTATYWGPKNIQHVVSYGMESSVLAEFPVAHLAFRLNAQYLSSVKENSSFPGDATEGKRLPYMPDFSTNARIIWRPSGLFDLSMTPRFVGARYSDESNSPDGRLDPVFVADAACSVHIPSAGMRWCVKGECFNLFDALYESIAFYPMPGRSFRITLSTDILTQE